VGETAEEYEEQIVQLLREIVNLRQNIIVHHMIGLNADEIEASPLSNALFGHLQFHARQSIALGICKIYEPQHRYQLNSIPGAIENSPSKFARLDGAELVNTFASSLGVSPTSDPRESLGAAVKQFLAENKAEFDQCKTYRDKVAAHSEAGIKIKKLPSHDSFESFYDFAYEAYAVMPGSAISRLNSRDLPTCYFAGVAETQL
jgi:hypothetical protein